MFCLLRQLYKPGSLEGTDICIILACGAIEADDKRTGLLLDDLGLRHGAQGEAEAQRDRCGGEKVTAQQDCGVGLTSRVTKASQL